MARNKNMVNKIISLIESYLSFTYDLSITEKDKKAIKKFIFSELRVLLNTVWKMRKKQKLFFEQKKERYKQSSIHYGRNIDIIIDELINEQEK